MRTFAVAGSQAFGAGTPTQRCLWRGSGIRDRLLCPIPQLLRHKAVKRPQQGRKLPDAAFQLHQRCAIGLRVAWK